MAQNVLITGGTGLVGTRITAMLQQKGYNISYLSRSSKNVKGVDVYQWNVKKQTIDEKAIANADYIVHLAGANVAGHKWTDSYKKTIIDSRLQSAQLLKAAIEKTGSLPKAFIAASAIGYYGNTGNNWATEESHPGDDFLADVCVKWEQKTDEVAALGVRAVTIRVGVVLSPQGGALPLMSAPVKFFAGAPLGSGDQYVSWIHIDDLANIFIQAMEDEQMQGVYNGVAPHPVTNEELTRALGSTLHRPVWPIGVPAFALKTALGEMSDTVLQSTRVSVQKLQTYGFDFHYPYIKDALKDLLK